jgi:hypothetical protein
MTRPLNEHLLWKGAIQRANYKKPALKPPMILPKINALTGKEMDPPNIHEEMNRIYSAYSKWYWAGVEVRKLAYRMERMKYCVDVEHGANS